MKKQNMQTHYQMDMTNGPVLRKMLLFAFPLMASSLLQLLFNAADVIVVGKFAGDNSLAAVGSTTSLIALMTNFFLGLSVGVNVLVAMYVGSNDEDNVEDTVHTAIMISLVSGIIILFAGVFGADGILELMQSPPEVLPLAALYLRIYFLGMPAMMIYNFGAAILRAVGDTQRPLYYLMFAGIVNVLLNLFFVIVLRMDVAGVALATVISQCISCALILRCLILEQSCVHLDLHKLRISKNKFFRILRIGLPASVQNLLFNISNILIQTSINTFGATVVAGSAAAANLEGFVYVTMNAHYQSTLSFTSQNMGAGKHDRIKRIAICGLCSTFVTGLVLGLFCVVEGRVLLSLYTSNPEVMDQGMVRIRMICSLYFLCGMMDVMVGVLRGLGYSLAPMFVSLIGVCGVRVIWILTFFRLPRFHAVQYLYGTYPVTWSITFLAHSVCFLIVWIRLQKKWAQPVMNSNESS